MADDIVTRLPRCEGDDDIDIVEWLRVFAGDDPDAVGCIEAADEIERLRAELNDAYDACRYALADSPRWQALAETVVHTYEEARRG